MCNVFQTGTRKTILELGVLKTSALASMIVTTTRTQID